MTKPPPRPTFVLAVWELELDRFHTITAHDRATVDFFLDTAPQGVPIFAFEVDGEGLERIAATGVGGRRRTDADHVQAFEAHARWCAAIHAGFPIEAVERAVWGDVVDGEAIAASESRAA